MSYTDPEIQYGKLASGDAGRITAAAEPVGSAITALDTAKGDLEAGRTTAASSWQGVAAGRFDTRAELSGSATKTSHTRLETAVRIVEAAASAYTTMRGPADNAIQAWRTRPPDLDEAGLTELANQVNSALDTVRVSYEDTLSAYATALTEIAPAFEEVAGGTESWEATALQPGLSVPPAGTDPQAVADWWASLSETERDQLLTTHYDELGQLQGLPADVLDDANRRRIDVDQARYGADVTDLDAQIAQRAEELGLDPGDEGALRLANDPELADLLDRQQDAQDLLDNADSAENRLEGAEGEDIDGGVYVLHYDPSGADGQGTLAVAFGNPDTADNVAVTVPGTGTDLNTNFPGQAADLRRQMDLADPNAQNATIAWLGYDAPDSLTSSDVAMSDNAVAGGDRLVADVAGYRAAAEAAGNTDQHLTAIGHSYGSTTVGYAGMNGLAADDIAFVGSPGVGASDASQLSPGEDHVWAGAAEHDPVVQLTQGSWFTEDGSTSVYDDSFGANVFGTPDGGNIADAHSNYYKPGSESLENLGDIATGNYDDVSDQSWRDDPLGSDAENAADGVLDVGEGAWEAGGEVLEGDFGDAWDTTRETAGEAANDVVDGVVDGTGELVEAGKDAYDNTIGRIPGL